MFVPNVAALACAALLCSAPLAVASQEPTESPTVPADGTAPVTTESGLIYSILEAGDATLGKPAYGDLVEVHYTGWLDDGTVFDSSLQERFPGSGIAPAEFRVGQVIEGWNEGLELMSPGARFKLTIPADLAYGDAAVGPIPASSTLTFEVELLGFEPGPELPAFRRVGEAAVEVVPGVRVEVIEAATRPAPEGQQVVKLDYVLWTPEGRVLDCGAWNDFTPLRCTPEQPPQPLAFLAQLMPQFGMGAKVVVEVSPEVFGQGQIPGVDEGEPTVWYFETLYVAYPPELPEFRRPAEGSPTLPETGVAVETLVPGEGEAIGTNRVRIAFTYWTSEGELVDSTLLAGRGPLATTSEQLRIPCLQELLPTMKVGGRALVLSSAEASFGTELPPGLTAGDSVVWMVDVLSRVEPLTVPEYRAVDDAAAQRTKSGLRIEVLKQGTGPMARPDQIARVHYAGWLASDGTLFDNSYERGEPSEFPITQVIDGWTETLLAIPVGTEVLVHIPWDLAYRETGSPPTIPPKADLVFRVELLDLKE